MCGKCQLARGSQTQSSSETHYFYLSSIYKNAGYGIELIGRIRKSSFQGFYKLQNKFHKVNEMAISQS